MNALNGLGFAAPLALLGALAVLPLIGAWWWEARRSRRAAAAYGGAEALRVGRSRARVRVQRALIVAVVLLVAAAAARPQWGTVPSPVQRQGIDVVIALDISRSMQATDIQPSRAAAAAGGLREMLRHLGGDRVGLVTFAGSAFARSPLTLDVDAIADLVNRAQRETALVAAGTDVGAAITAAIRLLDVPDPARTRAIVLISDGEDLGASLGDALAAAQRNGIRIYTVAAGTEVGAVVPATEAERPAAGAGGVPVTSRADRASLARIASDTGAGTRDVSTLPGLAVDLARLQQSQLDQGEQVVPIERLQWPLLLAAGLLLAHLLTPEGVRTRRISQPAGPRQGADSPAPARRAAGAAGLLGVMLITGCGGTEVWRKVEEGNRLYAQGQHADALGAYAIAKQLDGSDPVIDYNIGNTQHRLDRLDDAAAASKAAATNSKDGSLFGRATYALGSTAFRRNALPEARDAFVTVLQRDPADADARHNLEVVLRALANAVPTEQQGGEPGRGPQQGSPTPQPNGAPTPGAGQQGGQPQATATPGAGQPAPSPSPSQPQPGGPSQPGGAGPGQPSAPGAPDAERAADEALRQALRDLPQEVTPEDALGVLDAARTASEAGTLRRPGAGAQNPNDR